MSIFWALHNSVYMTVDWKYMLKQIVFKCCHTVATRDSLSKTTAWIKHRMSNPNICKAITSGEVNGTL